MAFGKDMIPRDIVSATMTAETSALFSSIDNSVVNEGSGVYLRIAAFIQPIFWGTFLIATQVDSAPTDASDAPILEATPDDEVAALVCGISRCTTSTSELFPLAFECLLDQLDVSVRTVLPVPARGRLPTITCEG